MLIKKVVVLALIILGIAMLSSCSDAVGMRVKTNDGSIITLYEDKSIADFYREGDTILIRQIDDDNWEIMNNGTQRRDTLYFSSLPTSDSTSHVYFVAYKNVLIEDIFDK